MVLVGLVLDWITSYVMYRQQFVQINQYTTATTSPWSRIPAERYREREREGKRLNYKYGREKKQSK